MKTALPLWSVTFFVLQLLAIAILPLTHEKFWERNRNKALISLILSLPVILIFLSMHDFRPIFHEIKEYFSFIVLLAALFIVSGGIYLSGDIAATPRNNLILLGIGALAANFLGTTGASMLLIRPILRTNRERDFIKHIPIFFIFIVGNIAGSLLPIGDPPLFMGFLRGIPFFWTISLWPEWLFAVATLLTLFYIIDRHFWKKESLGAKQLDQAMIEPIRLHGHINILLVIAIVASAVLLPSPLREIAMIAISVLSMLLTPKGIREKNDFNFTPIIEVAILFAGIFITMVPALLILESQGSHLGVRAPWHFFWATGILSSFLDNTPTYLTFFSLAQGLTQQLHLSPSLVGVHIPILRAISLGAVYMGANTYIGNAPNFMVKSICEHQRVKMPSFFGYMLWSGAILIPLFILVNLIFIR
jgi:Na+/H+ antiporter NhaD/arsenite permease-like protein